MSSAHEEADDGPVYNHTDEEFDSNFRTEIPSGIPYHDRKKIPARLQESEQFGGELEEEEDSLSVNGHGPLDDDIHLDGQQSENNIIRASTPEIGRPSSADGSLSIPDDTPSIQVSRRSATSRYQSHPYQGSLASSPGRRAPSSAFGRSPTPSLRPFDRRFQARLSPSPVQSPRALSPGFLNISSRQSSEATFQDLEGTDSPQAPWDVVRWTKLRKITGQAFSEVGKRNFGRPTCIAVSSSIAFGTSKGIILVFDYNQNLKSIIGPGTKGMSLV